MNGDYAAAALRNIGKPVVPSLIKALGYSETTRWRAAEILREIGDPRAVEPLIAALKDSDDWVRWHATEALGKIGDPRALPELERVVREDTGEPWWMDSAAETARNAIEKIRQRMAASQKGTA